MSEIPINATGPSEVFGQYKWSPKDIPTPTVFPYLNYTSTLLIGSGDLAALSLGIAGFFAWSGSSPIPLSSPIPGIPVFYGSSLEFVGKSA